MDKSKSFAIHTLGCKLNYSESSSIAKNLVENGFVKVPFKETASVYIINTCSVTQDADKECRMIVRTVLRRSPGAFIAVIGCYAQLKPEEIAKIEGVDIVLGASEKFNIANYLQRLDKNDRAEIHSCEIEEPLAFHAAYSTGDRTRSFLKVQDGCNYNCSYCTIPLARGASRSNTIENVIANVHEIAKQGTKEIVLTGVNLGDFGILDSTSDKHTQSFYELVQALDEVDLPIRYRISSIEPNLLKNEIIEFVAGSKRFVSHFHIPLQSGSDTILNKMRRRYLSDLYADRVTFIKSLMPYCCIGADVIVGYPGETEKEFLETYNFLNKLDVSYLHVFTYSERVNTLAVESADVVPVEIRRKRNRILQILSEKKSHKFYEQNIGLHREAIFENKSKDGNCYGFTDNYIKVKVSPPNALSKQMKQVILKSINADGTMSIDIPNDSIEKTLGSFQLSAIN